jgi:hypothetical protein
MKFLLCKVKWLLPHELIGTNSSVGSSSLTVKRFIQVSLYLECHCRFGVPHFQNFILLLHNLRNEFAGPDILLDTFLSVVKYRMSILWCLLYLPCRAPVFASANRRYWFVPLPPPTYSILWLSSPVGKLAVFLIKLGFCVLVNLFGAVGVRKGSSCLCGFSFPYLKLTTHTCMYLQLVFIYISTFI